MYYARAKHKLLSLYMYSAMLILLVSGIAKIVSVFDAVKPYQVYDPIFGIPYGNLLLFAGALELLLAIIIIKNPNSTCSLAAITVFASSLLAYRVSLWWIGWRLPCGCLGSLSRLLKLSPQMVEDLTKIILAYLVVVGYCFLIFQPRLRPDNHK
jgi:hypothetical protein